ncbi:hypothetical protein [Pseudomonas sp. DR48]|uniref:hypothetical protein n=1 Tax=Pseudomonas sp. DR48 TaxID=2871095 RepID=UPI0021BD2C98|nr:hypothetical protein [Pseudomonas sp. DR48]
MNIAMICRCAGSSENRIDCSSHESGYPKKKGRKDAAKAWAKLRPNDILHQTLIAALSSHCISEDWTKDGGRYIPNAATWLNGERLQDVLMPTGASSSPAFHGLPNHTQEMYPEVTSGANF